MRGDVRSVHVVKSILVINGACDAASRIKWESVCPAPPDGINSEGV
jgi:hypothetical protein